MTGIKNFEGQSNAIPYATVDTLKTYTQDQIAKFGEASFDEIVQLTIIREKIYQESALLAATNDIVVIRAMDRLESQIFAPGDDAVKTTYPVPAESIAPTERAEPITYNLQKVDLQMAETRYFISDDAKLRGASEWLIRDSARRAAENLATNKDKHVLTQLKTLVTTGNRNGATATWESDNATPEKDLAIAIGRIVKNSNVSTAQINKPQAFALIIPAASFVGVTKLKLIRNITMPIRDFLETEYKVRIVLSRKPRTESSWPTETSALVVPIQDSSIGFLGTFDGGGIVPAQERIRNSRGEDIVTKQWFKYITIPEPLDGSTTTNTRVAEITGVA